MSKEHIRPGVYRIKTCGHSDGTQPAGWGLSAWHGHGAERNGDSSWVAVHEGDFWPCDWLLETGTQPGTFRIKTMGHVDGLQPAGWGLSAWHAHGAVRNEVSSRVAVHSGDHWPCDWRIVPGKTHGTYRIITCGHVDGLQPEGWGLSAWHGHGAVRNDSSSWVYVHEGDHWPCDWTFERVKKAFRPGTYTIKTLGHVDGLQPAGWGLSAWHAHGAERNSESSWVAVHKDKQWRCKWRVEFGTKPGTFRIKTKGHAEGQQPAGWGLSAWHDHGAVRNESSSRVAVHSGDHWPCDWRIIPGKAPGSYRIITDGHADGHQPAGWGLSAWHGHGTVRDESSSWVHVHEGDFWPCDWKFTRYKKGVKKVSKKGSKKGIEPGVYRIKTNGHADGHQPAGWGLSAWHAHGAERNGESSWVAVHSGDHWPCNWSVEPGTQPGTYRIKTMGHGDGHQPAGWGLSAWHAHGAVRNEVSSRVAVHSGDHWPCDWQIVPGTAPGTYRIITCGHADGLQPAGWGLSAWHAHGAERNAESSWVHVHQGDHWPCDWIFERV